MIELIIVIITNRCAINSFHTVHQSLRTHRKVLQFSVCRYMRQICRYVQAQVCSPGPAQTGHTAQFRPAPAPASITHHVATVVTLSHVNIDIWRPNVNIPPRRGSYRHQGNGNVGSGFIDNLIFEQIYLILLLFIYLSLQRMFKIILMQFWMFPPLIVSGSSVFYADSDFTLSFFHKMISLLYK